MHAKLLLKLLRQSRGEEENLRLALEVQALRADFSDARQVAAEVEAHRAAGEDQMTNDWQRVPSAASRGTCLDRALSKEPD